MQRALFQQANTSQIQTQATPMLPGHGTGVAGDAVNDEVYHAETGVIRFVLSVLANVIGGGLLLSGMFFLPHLLAEIFK